MEGDKNGQKEELSKEEGKGLGRKEGKGLGRKEGSIENNEAVVGRNKQRIKEKERKR